MIHLTREYNPISLHELHQFILDREIPSKSVVVTFDDGYADNLWNVRPLLDEIEIPATIFVAIGFVEQDREMPSDILERCLLSSEGESNSLTLHIQGRSYSWYLETNSVAGKVWNVTMNTRLTPRQKCYLDLHRMLRPMKAEERWSVLDQLEKWAGVRGTRSDRRIMNREELREIIESGLVDIESHGVHHLVMTAQTLEDQERELRESKMALESWLGRSVTAFAYPYGNWNDVNESTAELARRCGFSLGCANVPGTVTTNSNPFLLPRFLVRNWDQAFFASQLRKAFYV